MKKFVSILIIICLVFGAAITYTGCGANNAAEPETSPEPSVEPSESVDDTETETASVPQLDFEALYASHDADEVVMTMDGEDVTWEEYFYWLYYSGVQVNNYINQMAANMSAYGMNVTWDDAADDTGISFKDYVVQLAEENIRQIHSIKKFSAENDVTLTEDNLKAIEEQRKTDMVNLCGEEVSDEEFLTVHDTLTAAGFEHYEVSNYALPGFRARHNASYWHGTKYLGIGPAAHSFDGEERHWNASSVEKYIAGAPAGKEVLTRRDRFNEYVMTALRTVEGIDLEEAAARFGAKRLARMQEEAAPFLRSGTLRIARGRMALPPEKFLISDAVIGALFET